MFLSSHGSAYSLSFRHWNSLANLKVHSWTNHAMNTFNFPPFPEISRFPERNIHEEFPPGYEYHCPSLTNVSDIVTEVPPPTAITTSSSSFVKCKILFRKMDRNEK